MADGTVVVEMLPPGSSWNSIRTVLCRIPELEEFTPCDHIKLFQAVVPGVTPDRLVAEGVSNSSNRTFPTGVPDRLVLRIRSHNRTWSVEAALMIDKIVLAKLTAEKSMLAVFVGAHISSNRAGLPGSGV